MIVALLAVILVGLVADLVLRKKAELEILRRIATITGSLTSASSSLVRIDDNLRTAAENLRKLGDANDALPGALTAIRGEFNRALERLEEKEEIPEIRSPSQREALMRVASVRATLEANEEASYQEWLNRATGKKSEG